MKEQSSQARPDHRNVCEKIEGDRPTEMGEGRVSERPRSFSGISSTGVRPAYAERTTGTPPAGWRVPSSVRLYLNWGPGVGTSGHTGIKVPSFLQSVKGKEFTSFKGATNSTSQLRERELVSRRIGNRKSPHSRGSEIKACKHATTQSLHCTCTCASQSLISGRPGRPVFWCGCPCVVPSVVKVV